MPTGRGTTAVVSGAWGANAQTMSTTPWLHGSTAMLQFLAQKNRRKHMRPVPDTIGSAVSQKYSPVHDSASDRCNYARSLACEQCDAYIQSC